MIKVALVIADDVNPFEIGVAAEVFGEDRAGRGVPKMDFRVVAERLEPVRPAYRGGWRVTPEDTLDFAESADVVVVPAFLDHGTAVAPTAIVDAIRTAHARGATILTLCTGAFIAARAGLLDGKRATTHWRHVDRLISEHPEIDVEPNALFIDEGSVVTSAGTAAGIDASLHVIRKLFGSAAATTIARGMVVPPVRDGGQTQYAIGPVTTDRADSLAPLVDWIVAHLDDDHSVASLAARAHLSERTLARRFREELGTTPMAWLTSQRVRRAQELLESTDYGLERVARSVGFGSAALLRHHFGQLLGTTPTAYRARFTCEADSAMAS